MLGLSYWIYYSYLSSNMTMIVLLAVMGKRTYVIYGLWLPPFSYVLSHFYLPKWKVDLRVILYWLWSDDGKNIFVAEMFEMVIFGMNFGLNFSTRTYNGGCILGQFPGNFGHTLQNFVQTLSQEISWVSVVLLYL